MSTQQNLPPNPPSNAGSGRERFAAFITSLPGIITAVATLIATIAGAFFGGKQVGQNASPPLPAVTVTATVTATPTAALPSSTPTASDSASAAAGPALLTSLLPRSTGNTGVNDVTVQLGTTQFQDSVRFSCSTYGSTIVYDVAGYGSLDTTLGVPSDATGAAGNTATISFFKDGTKTELGPPVAVTVGTWKKIHLALQGSVQLEIACQGTHSDGGGVSLDAALGTATLTP